MLYIEINIKQSSNCMKLIRLHVEILRKIVADRSFSEFKLNTVILERTAGCKQYITCSHRSVNLSVELLFCASWLFTLKSSL